MRNKLTGLLMLTLIAGYSTPLYSQDERSRRPFWVVEGNIKQPDYTIVKFYSGDGNLINEETIEGLFINIQKKKNRKYLDKRLASVIRMKYQPVVSAKNNKAQTK